MHTRLHLHTWVRIHACINMPPHQKLPCFPFAFSVHADFKPLASCGILIIVGTQTTPALPKILSIQCLASANRTAGIYTQSLLFQKCLVRSQCDLVECTTYHDRLPRELNNSTFSHCLYPSSTPSLRCRSIRAQPQYGRIRPEIQI